MKILGCWLRLVYSIIFPCPWLLIGDLSEILLLSSLLCNDSIDVIPGTATITPTSITLTPTPTDMSLLTPNATPMDTPSPTVTGGPHSMLVFASQDGLTIYVPANVTTSLKDLNLEFNTSTGPETYFFANNEGFAPYVEGEVPPPFCLHLERFGSDEPLPRECQSDSVHKPKIGLPSGGIFWWNEFQAGTKTLVVNLGTAPLDFCATGFSRCEVEIP